MFHARFLEHRFSGSSLSTAYRLTASVLLFAVMAAPASAQDGADGFDPSASSEPTISGQANLRGTVGVPRGGFDDNISRPGGGLNLFLGGWIDSTPVVVGLDLGFLSYGSTTDEVPLSSTIGPRAPVEVRTSNNILETHLSLRLQPEHGRVRPFVEGLAGFKYLFTRTSVGEENFVGEDPDDSITSSTNFDDFALSGGAGAGVDVRVYQQSPSGEGVRTVSLHLGVQYLIGQKAEYLAEGALADDNGDGRLGESELDIRRSRTTLLQPQFGVTFQLSGNDG